jgi:hypothetical protein
VYPAVLLIYTHFISSAVILLVSLASIVPVSLPYNKTGTASVLYNFICENRYCFITVPCKSLVTLEVDEPIEFHQAAFNNKVKAKLALEQGTKAQRGCRGIPVLFH